MLRGRVHPACPAMAPFRPTTASSSGTRRLVPAAVVLALGVVLALALVLRPGVLWAADDPARWTLSDQQGQRWAVSLFHQPDPAYPDGPRLRVTALTPAPRPAQAPSHRAALDLRDAFAGSWRLPNHSEELVPPDSGDIPIASAQFGLDGLSGTPSDSGPVRLEIPLASGATTTLVLGPAPTAALVELIAQA